MVSPRHFELKCSDLRRTDNHVDSVTLKGQLARNFQPESTGGGADGSGI